MDFAVARSTVSGRTVLRVSGELDLATTPQLLRAADEDPRRPLVVDLTGTTFMDSSGARALAQLARGAARQGVEMHVVCPRENSAVRLVVDLLDLRAVVPVVETLPLATGRAQAEEAP